MCIKTKSYPILFVLLMLLSGFAGISYEIIYGRILGNIIGDQFAVSSAILMTFLLGIGFGSAYAHRLWRWLWAIEAGIGSYGLLVAFSQPQIETIVYSGSSLFSDSLTGGIIVCVFILIIPAFFIGCSVPLFAGYFTHLRARNHAQRSFSWVYMIYNLGAAVTALAIEFYFIRNLGICGTVTLFAVVNILIGICLRLFFPDLRNQNENEHEQGSIFRRTFAIIETRRWLPLALASIASAIFQLFMIKYTELVFGPFRESFALVLALVLLGIALGSMLVRRFSLGFSTCMWLNLMGLLWLMCTAGGAIYVYAALYDLTQSSFWLIILLKGVMLIVLMLLPAISFGATIPALLNHKNEVSRESGALLFISSLANVFGFLLMVFFLHRLFDYGVQLLIVAAISTLSLLVYKKFNLRHLIPACLLLALIGGWQHYKWDENLLFLSYTNFRDLGKLRKERKNFNFPDRYKGYQDVFSINWMKGKPYFFINGYISIPLNNPSEKIVGAMSSLFAPRLDQALVLGLGSGATASSVGLFFGHTNVVEINPVVCENLFRMRQWNFDIENNPKVNIVVDDAIHYVKNNNNKYSMILNTVTSPLYFSSSKLYTCNFFKDITKRLTEDGIYITWMDSRIGDKGADIILRSLRQSFKHCAILYIKSTYFLLVASNKPLRVQQEEGVSKQQKFVSTMLKKYSLIAPWLPYQLLKSDVFSLINEPDGDLNTADFPALEFEMARLHDNGIPKFKRRLRNSFSLNDIKQALNGETEAFPADFLAQTKKQLGNNSITRRWKRLFSHLPGFTKKKKLAELKRRQLKAEVFNTAKNWHNYGYQLIRLNRLQEALQIFAKVIKLEPEHNNTYYNIGSCYEKLGNNEAALSAYYQEQKYDPKDKDVSYRIGKLLLLKGEYANALKALTRYITANKLTRGKPYFYRSLAYQALGRKKESLADLQLSLQLKEKEKQLLLRIKLP